jgi:hypothetical protein
MRAKIEDSSEKLVLNEIELEQQHLESEILETMDPEVQILRNPFKKCGTCPVIMC